MRLTIDKWEIKDELDKILTVTQPDNDRRHGRNHGDIVKRLVELF